MIMAEKGTLFENSFVCTIVAIVIVAVLPLYLIAKYLKG
jgi:hypothetical protein